MSANGLNRFLESRAFQRFWEIAGAASIRVKVLGIVLGVVVALGIFTIVQMNIVLTETLLGDLIEQGMALSNDTADAVDDLLRQGDAEMLVAFLAERQEHYSNESHNTQVSYLVVTTASGESYAVPEDAVISPELAEFPGEFAGHEETLLFTDNDVVEFRSVLPDTGATLHFALSKEPIRRTVNHVLLQLVGIILVMVAVGFGAAFLLTWILTRPLLELVEATQAVAAGDLSQRVSRWANDEIGELAVSFNAMIASLRQAEAERAEREHLREQYVSNTIRAQENERQRIARELHDSTSQSLTSLLVGLQNLKESGEPERGQRIDDLRGIVGQTLDEVRGLAWRLRPRLLDDLGLVSALRQYIDDYRQHYEIPVEYVASGLDSRLPPEMATAIYRIVQEGLTNIARYSKATRAGVILNRRGNAIRIIIEDDGVGFDPEAVRRQGRSLGLQGIRERAALFGGTLTIESAPGEGTTLFVEIPLSAENGRKEARLGTEERS